MEHELITEAICAGIDSLNADNEFTTYVAITPNGNIIVDTPSDFPDYIIHAFQITNEDVTDVRIRQGALT